MKTVMARTAFCFALIPFISPPGGRADTVSYIDNSAGANAPITYGGSVIDNIYVPGSGQGLTGEQPPSQNLGGFNIVIVPGPGLSGNAAALAAFNRAAAAWAARISDPITVTINADLAPLGAGIIGSTSSVTLQAGYSTVRNAVVADADANDGILSAMPTAAQFSATVPSGSSLNGNLLLTKANAKALGFTGLDGTFGNSDASMTFSSTFAFDFDHSNGVGAGLLDFETVAAHEIGHALGFVSFVDSIAGGATAISPFTLDLLRFRNNLAGQDPAIAAEFTTFPRAMIVGGDAITDAINDPEWRMSTGLTGAGDGRQASHWKDDDLVGPKIGIMDPTLGSGVFYGITDADFRALDLIGYNIIPEPSSLSLFFLGSVAVAAYRRRS